MIQIILLGKILLYQFIILKHVVQIYLNFKNMLVQQMDVLQILKVNLILQQNVKHQVVHLNMIVILLKLKMYLLYLEGLIYFVIKFVEVQEVVVSFVLVVLMTQHQIQMKNLVVMVLIQMHLLKVQVLQKVNQNSVFIVKIHLQLVINTLMNVVVVMMMVVMMGETMI